MDIDGYMMVGFSRGWVIAISTHMKEIGEELQSLKVHEGQLFDLCYSPQLNKLATCGDDGVRVVDMTDFKESKSEHREFKKEDGDPEKLEWTRDGQILTVATNGGCLYNFLMSIPSLATGHGAKLAYLSSLRGVTIIDAAVEGAPLTVDIAVEPSFIALGANQVAVGMNNHCWFYSLDRARPGLVAEREYVGTVKQIFLNDQYCVVLCDGKAHLHLIVPNPNLPEDREHKIFPDKVQPRLCINPSNARAKHNDDACNNRTKPSLQV
jgi:WD repeat-containing protein 19